eukprot:scaffold1875_cov253-Pinguiococcus_pyrenoidosus.AAC.20
MDCADVLPNLVSAVTRLALAGLAPRGLGRIVSRERLLQVLRADDVKEAALLRVGAEGLVHPSMQEIHDAVGGQSCGMSSHALAHRVVLVRRVDHHGVPKRFQFMIFVFVDGGGGLPLNGRFAGRMRHWSFRVGQGEAAHVQQAHEHAEHRTAHLRQLVRLELMKSRAGERA